MASPIKLSELMTYNPNKNPAGGFSIATMNPSTLRQGAAAAPNFQTPLAPLNPTLANLFKAPAPAAPVFTPKPLGAVAQPPAPVGPIQHTTALPGGNPSGAPVGPTGATGTAPANQTPIPPNWRRADGSLKTPDEIAAEVGGALKAAHGQGDVGKLALGQFGNQNKTREQLEAEARRIGNTRNDIAVGETDPYKVASESGIAYTPAELSAIEKAYAGIYDPALDTALAKVNTKADSDKAAADAKAQLERDQKQPYTLSPDQVRYDGDGNPVAVGLPKDSGGAGGTYAKGSNATVDAYVKGRLDGTYKASDIPDDYKGIVAQGVAAGKPKTSKTSNDAISLIDELSGENLEKITGFRIGDPSSFFPGSATQTTQNLAKQLSGILALQNRSQLQGQGAISDFEFRVLGDAASALGIDANGRSNLSEADLKAQLSKLKLKLQVGETDLSDDELLYLQSKGYTPDQIKEYSAGFSGVGNTTASTGNRPQRNNNPGNVKSGGLADSLATGKDEQGHLVFPDKETGFKALSLDLTAKINGGSRYLPANPTIAQLGSVYAEDPNWPKKVAQMLGVTTATSTKSVPFDKLVQAVATQEGFYA